MLIDCLGFSKYIYNFLLCVGKKFPAHKVLLACRSEYFRALLFGGLKESQQNEVELKSAGIPAFKALLKYIYTGHILLSSYKVCFVYLHATPILI